MEKFREYLKEKASQALQLHTELKEQEANSETPEQKDIYNHLAAAAFEQKSEFDNILDTYDKMLSERNADETLHQMD